MENLLARSPVGWREGDPVNPHRSHFAGRRSAALARDARPVLAAGAFFAVLAARPPAAAAEPVSPHVDLKCAVYDAALGPPPARRLPEDAFDGAAPGRREGWIVVLRAAPGPDVRRALEGTGARLVGWIPENAYLVRGTGGAAARLRALPAVLRVDRYEPEWKIAPELETRSTARRARRAAAPPGEGSGAGGARGTLLTADVFEGEDFAAVETEARAAGLEIVRSWQTERVRRLIVRAPGSPTETAEWLAALPEVEWVEDLPFVEARNDTVRWVIQSNVPHVTPLYDHGLFGAGQILGLIDGPVSLNSCFFVDPDVPEPGPSHRKLVSYHSSTGFGLHPHGTHVAGIAAGDREPTAGVIFSRGMAPKARIAFTSFFDVQGGGNTISNLDALLTQHHAEGGRVHSNSWGEDFRSDYVTWCRDIDLFSRANEEDLVLFSVTNTPSLAVPENAKNVLAVGATQRPPLQENHGSGGAGPTNDGRRKPEIFAPGIATISAATSSCATTSMQGTSMACPAVAGGALLVREYLMRGYHPTGAPRAGSATTPSGALLKAMLLNAGRDMSGLTGYPNDQEGWGRLLLDDVLYFSGDPERLWFRDVRHSAGLSTGESDTYVVRVVDSSMKLRITFVFTDRPAALGANPASVNDLDLEVEGPGGLFLGNVFDTSTGLSTTGGADDPKNNVERVILGAPTPGEWTLRVVGESVPFGPQGYALVVNGGIFPVSRAEIAAPFDASPESPGLRGDESIGAIHLAAPRPNPFAGGTTIRLALPSPAAVRLAVYDAAGRRIRVLADETMPAGSHDLVWDGRGDDGRLVPSGVYFVRFVSGAVDRRVKAVLLR